MQRAITKGALDERHVYVETEAQESELKQAQLQNVTPLQFAKLNLPLISHTLLSHITNIYTNTL